jgi:hypothetical protein
VVRTSLELATDDRPEVLFLFPRSRCISRLLFVARSGMRRQESDMNLQAYSLHMDPGEFAP